MLESQRVRGLTHFLSQPQVATPGTAVVCLFVFGGVLVLVVFSCL